MAKINYKTSLLGATLLSMVSVVTPAFAQSPGNPDDQALETEDDRYWDVAEVFYRKLIEREPGRTDLWRRLGEILVAQGDRDEDAADVFEIVGNLEPQNPNAQVDAAASYSVANMPEKATSFIDRAIQLEPDNPEHYNFRAVLETWLDDFGAAEKSMKRAFALGLPRNEDNLVRLATLQQWQNKMGDSTATMKEVIERFGGGEGLYLNLARLYSYRGKYVVALGYLEDFKEAGGEEIIYIQEKSLYFAWAGWPDTSMAISAPALAENPDEPQLLIPTAISNQRLRNYDEMNKNLDRLDQITGPNAEAKELRAILTSDTRSNVDAQVMGSTDRDDVNIYGGSLVLTYAPKAGTYIRFGAESYRLNAPSGGGLDRVDTIEGVVKSSVWAEVEAPFSNKVWGSFLAGESLTSFGPNDIKINTQLNISANQSTTVTFGYSRDLFITSPRTISLGIVRNEASARVTWTPNLNWYVEISGGYLWLNDTNKGGQGELTIIRKVMRRDKMNLDIGFNANWLGYEKDLPNGYYDPSLMQRYFVPFYFYFKFSGNSGLNLTISPGVIKDNTMNGFKFAGVASMELTVGLHRDWMMKANISGYIGGSGSALNANLSNYFIVSGGMRLVRRF